MKHTSFHFIGIGGIGMSALARILLDQKRQVSGSDVAVSATVNELKEKGAVISQDQTGSTLSSEATVVYSTDIKESNAELQKAKALQCPLLHRSELLRDLAKGYKTLAVAGTHGKTTTTSLLATVLLEANCDPTFAIGGIVKGLATNGKSGKGDYFVLEADESDGSFLNYTPFGAIVTNVEPEHMSHWGSVEKLHEGFRAFAKNVLNHNHLFYCGDDPVLTHLMEKKGFSYGFGAHNDLRIENFRSRPTGISLDLHFQGKVYRDVEVALLGKHNALNAAAVFGLALTLQVSEEALRSALKSFQGVKRRLEKKHEINEVLLIDDYAHHPTEIEATLSALRGSIGERRLIACFQPHRYTRVSQHLLEFARSFDFADVVIVTDIYSAREEPIPGITPEAITAQIKEVSTVPCHYVKRSDCATFFADELRPHDVLITLGAGDITALHQELIPQLKPRKYTLGLIFGGKSAEHEISFRSARSVANALNPSLYDVKYFGIDKEGKWIFGKNAQEYLQNKTVIDPAAGGVSVLNEKLAKEIESCDLFFPVLHGPYGEDGTIQGFFEMLSKPYVGPDFRSAAISMDKVLTKRILKSASVPTPPFLTFSFWNWRASKDTILKEIQTLKYPLFVKPTRLGSSIGIHKVHDQKELVDAIKKAFRYSVHVLVEEGQEECRELEFAVVGNCQGRIAVPHPGEKCAQGAFVSYDMKYNSACAVQADVNPTLDPELLKKGKQLVEMAYEALGVTGMSRVDCLLDPQGNYHFFEINAIPGMTPLSLFPKIWNRDGVPMDRLVDRLIILALHRYHEELRHTSALLPQS